VTPRPREPTAAAVAATAAATTTTTGPTVAVEPPVPRQGSGPGRRCPRGRRPGPEDPGHPARASEAKLAAARRRRPARGHASSPPPHPARAPVTLTRPEGVPALEGPGARSRSRRVDDDNDAGWSEDDSD
jgi:hypothetical protein